MNEMYVDFVETFHFDVDRKLRQLVVQLFFMLAPVVAIFPVCYKSLDVCEGNAVFSLGIRKLVREFSKLEFLLQRRYLEDRDRYGVRLGGCHGERLGENHG